MNKLMGSVLAALLFAACSGTPGVGSPGITIPPGGADAAKTQLCSATRDASLAGLATKLEGFDPSTMDTTEFQVAAGAVAAAIGQLQVSGVQSSLRDAAVTAIQSFALGHAGSASSSNINPSIRLTGRLATDAAGTMQIETELRTGTGSQTQNLSRWGDYSAMTVDPVDDCTFWYTSEYLKTNGTWNWNTWIASFKFDSCGGGGGPTTGTLSGTVTDSSTLLPIAGATVTVSPGGSSTNTDGSGNYSLTLAAGTYDVTASAAGHNSSTANGVSMTVGATIDQDFALVPSGGGGTVPGQPAAPSVSVGPGKGVSVAWSAPSDGGSPITGYTLNRYSGASCGTLSATFSLGNVLKYKDTSTTAGVSYCYAVAATNANGTGTESAKSSAVTPTK